MHGEIAGRIKDKLESLLGEMDWQCIVGDRGEFGCCFSSVPYQYLSLHTDEVAVIVFKAAKSMMYII